MAMAPSLLSFSFFFLLTCFSFNAYSSSASPTYYKDHCASIVPEANVRYQSSSFVSVGHQLQTAYFNGADRVLGANPYSQQHSIFVRLEHFGETDVSGVFQVSGSISITSTSPFYYVGNFSYGRFSYYEPRRSSVTIMLDGFWSASTGKICMVGSGSDYSTRGNTLDLDVVLKLNNVFNSSNISSVVSGSLDRLKNEGFDFETFPVLMILQLNYEFTLDSEESKHEFSHAGNDDADKGLPENNLNNKLFCSSRVWAAIRKLKLEYSGDCNTPKNCTPYSGIPGFLPNFISLNLIECTFTEKKQLRILINFGNHGYEDFGTNDFNPKTTLVGEGWWDEKKNHLNVLACYFLGLTPNSSFSGVHVGDCSVRLKLRFPSIWSIKDTSTVVGQIWSNKTVKDPDFFKAITFRKEDDQNVADVQGLKYEYSQQDTVKSLCPRSNVNNKGRMYPNPYYYDMKFDMSVRDSIKEVALGHSSPLSVGDQFYELVLSTKSATSNFITSGLFNISYKIRMSLSDNRTLWDKRSLFSMHSETVEISAEGVYDAGAGSLCMVGCRILPPSNNVIPMSHSVDCEILVKFHFPPLYRRSAVYIVGSIESTRNESDPLYFNLLSLSSNAMYKEVAREIVERMDMEIIMVLISTTLYCVLVGFQLYHVKKNPQVLPFISLTMLSILTLYLMIPLVLNFEALFSQNHNAKSLVLSNVSWPESNQITVRLITMVAFLMQFCLLQLTWSARNSTDGTQDSLWIAEKEAVYATLPLFAFGFLIALVKGKNNNNHYLVAVSSSYQKASSWEVLKSYGGLVNDGFLLPQIMMNMFSNMKQNALCGPFYLGTSFLRLLPHVYDLYRSSQYDRQYSGSYLYADPSADFYSTAWDLAIIVGCLLFAPTIYLQQRFGGSFILPSRFTVSETYEMVPIVTQEAEEVEVEEGTPKI